MISSFIFYILIIYIICNNYSNEIYQFNNTYTQVIHNKNLSHQPTNQSKSLDKRKNLILGIIERHSLNTILPFFKSFIQANFKNCDVVMFVRNINNSTIKYLESIGVYIYIIPEKYKKINVINIRWKMYIDYLRENKLKYKLILHTDVRDVFFQKDVFEYYENSKPFLGVAIEDGTLNCQINKRWIISYVGKEKYNIIKNERIICVGSIWGTYEIFLNFCEVFWKRLLENPLSIEQGIANYMFSYEKLFSDYLLKSDNYGPVMTIGKTKPHNIIFDSDENILNFSGEIAAVIHQYDRKKDIVQKVIKKYCPELYHPKNEQKKKKKKEKQNISEPNIRNKFRNSLSTISSIKTKSNKVMYKNIFFHLIISY